MLLLFCEIFIHIPVYVKVFCLFLSQKKGIRVYGLGVRAYGSGLPLSLCVCV